MRYGRRLLGKFMVGYEMRATLQRDLSPESAVERLRGAGY
jgi:hypothetical protein